METIIEEPVVKKQRGRPRKNTLQPVEVKVKRMKRPKAQSEEEKRERYLEYKEKLKLFYKEDRRNNPEKYRKKYKNVFKDYIEKHPEKRQIYYENQKKKGRHRDLKNELYPQAYKQALIILKEKGVWQEALNEAKEKIKNQTPL